MSATAPAVNSRQERRLLAVLAIIQFTVIADFMTVSPTGPLLMEAFQVGPRDIGWLMAAYTLSAAVMGLISAMVSDRLDRKRWLLVLYGGFVLAAVASSLATSFGMLMVARSFAGAFAGVIGATVMTIISDLVPEARRGRATGVVMTAFAMATVIGVPMAIFLAARFGWPAPFVVLAAVSALIWLVACWRVPVIDAHVRARRERLARGETLPSPLRALFAVMREPSHRRAFGLILLVVGGGFMVIPYISLHLVFDVKLTMAELPIVYLVGGAATFISARKIGAWADRYGRHLVFRWLALAAIVPFLAVTHLPPVSVWTASLVVMLFFVLVSGRFVPMMAIATTVPKPAVRGAFMSLIQTVQSLTQGLATTVGGLLLGQSPEGGLLNYNWIGWVGVATTLVAWYWVRRVTPAPT